MLKDKTALVTGAGRGIGRAIARRLASAGAAVVAVARNQDELSETQTAIERADGRCLAISADVTLREEVERVVDEVLRALGRVDMLVNNAGVAPMGPIDALEPEQFDHLVATNVRSVYLCCRAVWPHFCQHGGGVIVNISSVAGDDPFPGFAAYGGTKAFVNTFSRALAAEGRPHRIRVYCVAPGAVDTQMLRGPFPDFPADETLQPDDVAALVEWLLMPGAEHISGQTIRCMRSV